MARCVLSFEGMPARAALVVPLIAAACESSSGPARTGDLSLEPGTGARPTERATPDAHYGAAGELALAIVHGRLSDVRDLGGWIAANASPRSAALVATARKLEHADDVPTAAVLAGQLAGACGSCHEQHGATPRFSFGEPPADTATIEGQMHRHAWAAARLWEGVTGPAQTSWAAGARALEQTSIDIGATTNAKPSAEVAGLAEQMHAFAVRAPEVSDTLGRAQLYAEVLHTCASCHAIVRPQAVARSESALAADRQHGHR